MTPPASAAARALPPARTPTARRSRPASGHARSSAPSGSPSRRPRRISGPAGGIAAAVAPAFVPEYAPEPRPAPRPAPPRPGRSRTAPKRSRRSAPRVRRLSGAGLAGALSLREQLTWRRLPRALAPGRLWIGVVAFALIGIVTMQLSLLRLNTSIGSDLEQAAALQRENAALSIGNSEAGSGEAIEQKARQDGMHLVAPGDLRFIEAGGQAAVMRAARALRSSKVQAAGISTTQSTPGYVTSSTGETALEAPPSVEGAPASAEAGAVAGSEAGAVAGGEAGAVAGGEVEPSQTGGEAAAGGYAGSEGTSTTGAAPSESGASQAPTGGEGTASAGGGETSASATGEAAALGAGGGVQAGG